MEYLHDVRRWWWWPGSGVWKGEGSGAKPVSRLPGHGSDASKRSEICSLRAHWPVRLTLQYTITYYSTLYLPTRPLLTPPLLKPVYQLPYLRRMYSKISKRDFPKVTLQYQRIMCLLIAGTRKSMRSNYKKNVVFKITRKVLITLSTGYY